MQYIYLIELSQGIYKIGKSKRYIYDRLKEYKNGIQPIVHFIYGCLDCDTVEKEIKDILNINITKEKYYGSEYYSGDIEKIKRLMMKYFLGEENIPLLNKVLAEGEDIPPQKRKKQATEKQLQALQRGREIGTQKLKEKGEKTRQAKATISSLKNEYETLKNQLVDCEIIKLQTQIEKQKLQHIEALKEDIEILKMSFNQYSQTLFLSPAKQTNKIITSNSNLI